MCKVEGMGIAPWGALGGGNFKTEAQRRSQDRRRVEASDTDIKASRALEAISSRRNSLITSVALAYVLHKAPYVFPILGGRKVEHLKDNIDALTLELTREEIDEIESAVPFELGFPHNLLWGEKIPQESSQKVLLCEIAGSYDYVPEPQVRKVRNGGRIIFWKSTKGLFSNALSPSSRQKLGSGVLASSHTAGVGYQDSPMLMLRRMSINIFVKGQIQMFSIGSVVGETAGHVVR